MSAPYASNPQYQQAPQGPYATPMPAAQNPPPPIYVTPAYPAPAPAPMPAQMPPAPYPGMQQQQQQMPYPVQQPYPGGQQPYAAPMMPPNTTVVNNYPTMVEPGMPQQTTMIFNKPPAPNCMGHFCMGLALFPFFGPLWLLPCCISYTCWSCCDTDCIPEPCFCCGPSSFCGPGRERILYEQSRGY